MEETNHLARTNEAKRKYEFGVSLSGSTAASVRW